MLPGIIANSQDLYVVLDVLPQALHVASKPGLMIALRSADIVFFSQCGHLIMVTSRHLNGSCQLRV
jgi:hypothetical protein